MLVAGYEMIIFTISYPTHAHGIIVKYQSSTYLIFPTVTQLSVPSVASYTAVSFWSSFSTLSLVQEKKHLKVY